MGYKKTHKYFDKDSDPWRRRITGVAVAENDDHPVGKKVLFVLAHPRMSDYAKSFVGQEGEVISHSKYPWEGVKWCVRFPGHSLWLRPRYLQVIVEDQES